MKLQPPANENYAATVVSIKAINQLENCDNVVGTPIFGFQAIVGKETKVGDLGIVFPAESQLSEQFAHNNNLYRHASFNKDDSKAGYLEDNRRVKAMKFRGHRSDCLFMPLESLAWAGVEIEDLKEGDTFDSLNGKEICRKYVIKTRGKTGRGNQQQTKKIERVDKKLFPEHIDTDNFWKNVHLYDGDKNIVVTQKLHGTSLRASLALVSRKLNRRERLAQKLGVKVQIQEYDYVYGSRKVVKDANNPDQNHFYGQDLWGHYGAQLNSVLPENFIIYGELIGWTLDNEPIQKNYTYRIPQGTADLYVYRIAQVNPQGRITDLTWDQVKEFSNQSGLKHVPELWRGKLRDFDVDAFMDKRYFDDGYTQAVQMENGKELVDEGVCIRIDGLTPVLLKAKSPVFLRHESKMLDKEEIDIEAEESNAA